MKRKVVLHGPSTLIVSLPINWTRKYGIKRGDEVEVEENSGSLLINAEGSFQKDRKVIDVSKVSPLIRRILVKTYQNGYDDVEVRYDNPELVKKVQSIVGELIGFEIVGQGKNHCLLKGISRPAEENFDALFRRIFLIIKDILEDGEHALENKDKRLAKSIIYRDQDLNKIVNFCIRVLNKNESEQREMKFAMIHTCERIGDEYKKLLSEYLDGSAVSDKSLIKLHKKMRNFYGMVYKFTFDRTAKNAMNIAKENESFQRQKSKGGRCFENLIENMLFIQELQLSEIKDI